MAAFGLRSSYFFTWQRCSDDAVDSRIALLPLFAGSNFPDKTAIQKNPVFGGFRVPFRSVEPALIVLPLRSRLADDST